MFFTETGLAQRAAEAAATGFHVHPHMLATCLVNEGTDTRLIQAHLGHKNIQHTVRHTVLSAKRLVGVRVR